MTTKKLTKLKLKNMRGGIASNFEEGMRKRTDEYREWDEADQGNTRSAIEKKTAHVLHNLSK